MSRNQANTTKSTPAQWLDITLIVDFVKDKLEKSCSSGFILLELLVALAILTITIAGGVVLWQKL